MIPSASKRVSDEEWNTSHLDLHEEELHPVEEEEDRCACDMDLAEKDRPGRRSPRGHVALINLQCHNLSTQGAKYDT